MNGKGVEIILKNIDILSGSIYLNNSKLTGADISGYMTLEKLIASTVSDDCKKVNMKIIIQELDTEQSIEVQKVDLNEKLNELKQMMAEMLEGEESE